MLLIRLYTLVYTVFKRFIFPAPHTVVVYNDSMRSREYETVRCPSACLSIISVRLSVLYPLLHAAGLLLWVRRA